MTPLLSNLPEGVTASDFQIGEGLGSVFDNGGGTDSLRISGNDGITNNTTTGLSNKAYLSFKITIPAGISVSLESLTVDYKVTSAVNLFNSRVFSSIKGVTNATNHTIGILGRRTGGSDASFTTGSISLLDPIDNTTIGVSIGNADFKNISGEVTFYFPFISGTTASTAFIDLDNVTLSFVGDGPVMDDFRVLADHSAQVSFSGEQFGRFSLLASNDLKFPLYRKQWSLLSTGNFSSNGVLFSDVEAESLPLRFYVVTQSGPPKARIMPVGDSITEGASNFVVYKGPLYDSLTAAGYRFTYVGSKSSDYASGAYGTVALRHEGYSGSNATQVASNLALNFAKNPADIVIIHAGHNMNVSEQILDAAGEAAIVSTVEAAMRSMINTCRTGNPKVKILLAQVIPAGKLPKYSYIPALNVRLGQIAQELHTETQPVISVNQADGFFWQSDTISDMVHPNTAGGQKMAGKFFDALAPLLG